MGICSGTTNTNQFWHAGALGVSEYLPEGNQHNQVSYLGTPEYTYPTIHTGICSGLTGMHAKHIQGTPGDGNWHMHACMGSACCVSAIYRNYL